MKYPSVEVAELEVFADGGGDGAGPVPVVLVAGRHGEAARSGAEGLSVCGVALAVGLHRLAAVREELASSASVALALVGLVRILLWEDGVLREPHREGVGHREEREERRGFGEHRGNWQEDKVSGLQLSGWSGRA